MDIIELKVTDLIPYENNPRHNDEAVDKVAESIRQFGFKVPIIIDRDKVIVAGHTRLKASIKLGLETVPCIMADDLTDEQIRAFRLADNKTSELATWDFEKLEEELRELDQIELDFDMTDFGFEKIGGGVESPDIIEDEFDDTLPEDPKTKPGDIYELGDHRLICGDSTDPETIAKLMDGSKADMVFTDPPYNVAIGSKNAFLNSVQKARRCTEDIANDKGMTDEEIGEKLWLPAFQRMIENSSESCGIYVTMPQGGTHMMMMMMMMKRAGWQVKHELMWEKNAPTFSMGRLDYDYQHEPICYGWNKSHVFYGNGDQQKSIWKYDKPRKCDLHPTMKPIELIANAIKNSSINGDIVMDLFGGSGSTLIACEQLKRRCYMCELDPRYVDVIVDRWEKFTDKKAKLVS